MMLNKISKPLRLFFFLVILLGLYGCTTATIAIPDWTTYPVDKEVTVYQEIPLIPGPTGVVGAGQSELKSATTTVTTEFGGTIQLSPQITTLNRTITEYGDTAEEEIYIVPRNNSEFNENSLLARVQEGGERACKTDFKVVGTKYFYGTEATLGFLGITTPALRAVYRCAISIESNLFADAIKVQKMSETLGDANYFDIVSKEYPISYVDLVDIIQSLVNAYELPIIEEERNQEEFLLIGGISPSSSLWELGRWGVKWGRSRLALVVSGTGQKSRLTFKYHTYRLTYHERGVLSTSQPRTLTGSEPDNRNVAFVRAQRLLGDIEDRFVLP